MTGLPTYPDCEIKRQPPSVDVDKDIAEKVSKDYKVLPLFEKYLFEHKYKQYYSLQTNKFLNCRWRSYVKHYEERTFAPFSFVDIRDFHFYDGMIRLLPSESIHRTTNFPFKLGIGPGVDYAGQMPIPQDMMMKRGVSKPKGRKNSKTVAVDQNEIKDKKP
ncbi:hypothetical protein PYW07_013305 [Mythimna separata]|uniref:Uncharacterized protein n=1 Tax=Mythimna separata TaxID=271217 RepID=A0AAD7Y605_MYTSE|nr:hypothetical protein PYW07_013305 [Mythimna separata]